MFLTSPAAAYYISIRQNLFFKNFLLSCTLLNNLVLATICTAEIASNYCKTDFIFRDNFSMSYFEFCSTIQKSVSQIQSGQID